ncbi:unnamed protein product, partial [Ectocarpus sp. 8 AP-2014]
WRVRCAPAAPICPAISTLCWLMFCGGRCARWARYTCCDDTAHTFNIRCLLKMCVSASSRMVVSICARRTSFPFKIDWHQNCKIRFVRKLFNDQETLPWGPGNIFTFLGPLSVINCFCPDFSGSAP